jgi:ankyrin repeat protein
MKIKNLLLLLVLLNGFAARPSFAAGAREAPGEVEVTGRDGEGAEERKGPDDEDAPLPAGAGTRFGGGAERAAAGVTGGALASTGGPIAKIELLRGSLTGALPAMQGASLLHGAMLWEFGIVKMLYALLLTPEEVELNGERILIANSAFCPLGRVLMELFYLADGDFQPTKSDTSSAKYLKQSFWGLLYAKSLQGGSFDDVVWPVEQRQYPGGWSKLETSLENLKQAFKECNESYKTVLNPQNLLPSIIMAFFWAKFVHGISLKKTPTLQAAQNSIKLFMAGAIKQLREDFPSVATTYPALATVDVDVDVYEPEKKTQNLAETEAEVIARIKSLYHQYNIPKPPFQSIVTIAPLGGGEESPRIFPDCGETGLRALFCSAFYDRDNKSFVVPVSPEDVDVYLPELRSYFEKYSTVEKQSLDDARRDWATLCSDRSGIVYKKFGCNLSCRFENVISLLGILAPAAIPKDCLCHEPVVGPGGATIGGALSGQTYLHDKNCAEKILTHFCTMPEHKLAVTKFTENNDNISWNITSAKLAIGGCSLYFNTRPGHMDCELRIEEGDARGSIGQIQDPILAAVSAKPENSDYIEPLVFFASRMAQHRIFTHGYVRMYFMLTEDQRLLLCSNIKGWELMLPEQAALLTKINDTTIFVEAIKCGYYSIVKSLIDAGADVNAVVDESEGYTVLMQAALYGQLQVVKLLLESGATINAKSIAGKTAFWFAMLGNYPDIVMSLLKAGLSVNDKDNTEKTLLVQTADVGRDNIAKLLLDAGADVDAVDYFGSTALMMAAELGYINLFRLLLDRGADVSIADEYGDTALMRAIKEGNLDIIQLLLDRGARCTQAQIDRIDYLFQDLPEALQERILAESSTE